MADPDDWDHLSVDSAALFRGLIGTANAASGPKLKTLYLFGGLANLGFIQPLGVLPIRYLTVVPFLTFDNDTTEYLKGLADIFRSSSTPFPSLITAFAFAFAASPAKHDLSAWRRCEFGRTSSPIQPAISKDEA